MIVDLRPIPCFPAYSATADGRIFSHIKGRFLKPYKSPDTYMYVQVAKRSRSVHSLVLAAFKGPRPPGMEARHLDGDSTNNAASNLEWGTHKQNVQDKYKHGTMLLGERAPNAVISNEQAHRLRERRAAGALFRELAAEFAISISQAHRICHGQARRFNPDGSPKGITQ